MYNYDHITKTLKELDRSNANIKLANTKYSKLHKRYGSTVVIKEFVSFLEALEYIHKNLPYETC